jgi:F5/8 type C domain
MSSWGRGARVGLAALLMFAGEAKAVAGAAAIVVDDFESSSPWSAVPADGVNMKLATDAGDRGRALRIDFDFAKGGGYAVAHRAVDLTLPARYAFVLRIRGECLAENLELKLIDSTGANVWWCNRRDFVFPRTWSTLVTRRRQIGFAWGPIGGGEIRRVKAIEFAITAGQGGKGTVWLDQLELRELPPPSDAAPVARASSAARGGEPALALDGSPRTAWRSAAADRAPWLLLDFGAERELGGLVLDWLPGRHPARYVVEARGESGRWSALRTVVGNGGRDVLALPETDASALRIRALHPPPGGCALGEVRVEALAWAATREAFFEAVAKDAKRGDYPRSILGEQSYWTVVGVDGDTREALVSEDGAIEAGKRGFSVEPFVWTGSRLLTWADTRITRRLDDNALPIPTVRWEADSLALEITAFATGPRAGSSVIARYRLRNQGVRARRATLYLAIRPFQVNPPAQFLNTAGGVSPIRSLRRQGAAVRVDDEGGVVARTAPAGFGATTFDEGNVVDWLRRGALPPRTSVVDSFEFASAALSYPLVLAPREGHAVDLEIPLHGLRSNAVEGAAEVERLLGDARDAWRKSLDHVTIELPPVAAPVVDALRAQIGFILVNRDGPAIQPGSRAYERSWIRDGSLTSSALLRMGHPEVVREFIDWFGQHQYDNGKIPCCVDHRGADPVPEHDSHGEFVFLVAEYFRITGDRASVQRWWPRVLAAAGYLDSLRAPTRTPASLASDRREFHGILPPSISHEGYSAKPMHSYWDDLFALRGYEDAAYLASALRRPRDEARLERSRAEFARDLAASIRAAMARHRIDYVPGCADLGDFDATSTTIALAPVQAGSFVVPRPALERTFERYWQFFEKRRAGKEPWEAFTPYEWRTVGAFVRLGRRDRANAVLDWFMGFRRPPGWPQWPEVVWKDERAPHFLGDLPHTWVGSDFVRSVLDMLAYERESDDALVLGAGAPPAWLDGPGIVVRGLRTRYGPLDFTAKRTGDGYETRVSGVRRPRGGIVLALPGVTPRWTATIDGRPGAVAADGSVRALRVPVTITLSPPVTARRP